MNKLDYKKILPSYKAKSNEFSIIKVPKLRYLIIDGHGDPNTSDEFASSIKALYPIAYKIKFTSKLELGRDYVIMPLEGLWWANDMSVFTTRDKSKWDFSLMIMQPEWITEDIFKVAVSEIIKKKGSVTNLEKVRFEELDEDLCIQTLHIGSFDDEAQILDEMHNRFIPDNSFKMTGKHHEIYFSDFRKTEPSKLRTILRQPVIKV